MKRHRILALLASFTIATALAATPARFVPKEGIRAADLGPTAVEVGQIEFDDTKLIVQCSTGLRCSLSTAKGKSARMVSLEAAELRAVVEAGLSSGSTAALEGAWIKCCAGCAVKSPLTCTECGGFCK